MAKVMINDQAYYTEDFNEEQSKAYAEAVDCGQEIKRMKYMIWLLEGRQNDLAQTIVDFAQKEDAPEDNAEETTEA